MRLVVCWGDCQTLLWRSFPVEHKGTRKPVNLKTVPMKFGLYKSLHQKFSNELGFSVVVYFFPGICSRPSLCSVLIECMAPMTTGDCHISDHCFLCFIIVYGCKSSVLIFMFHMIIVSPKVVAVCFYCYYYYYYFR